MSIWSDMEDRSAGITKRKEDEIEDSIIRDNHQQVFFGVANSIADLPQNVKPGSIYITKDTNQIVIFQNNMWTSIGESVYSR